MKNKFIQFYSNPLLILVCLLIPFIGNGQYGKTIIDNNVIAIEANDVLDIQKIILEYNFGIPIHQLTKEQIENKYHEMMQDLSIADREELIAMVKKGLKDTPQQAATQRNATPQNSESKITAETIDDGYGWSVEAVGNKVYIGGRTTEKVLAYSKVHGSYNLDQEITPNGTALSFGYSISVSGDWMAVGAPEFNFCGELCNGAGQVFMFKKQGNTWQQKAILTGPEGNTEFGRNVVLKGDQLVVLSLKQTTFPSSTTKNVFVRNGNNWNETADLNEPGYAFFSLDMSDDGNYIIGTGGVDNFLGLIRVFIYTKNGNGWDFEDKVIFAPGAFLPLSAAIDNNTIVLSSLFGGKIWTLTPSGSTWSVEQEIPHFGFPGSAPYVDIHGDKIALGIAATNNLFSETFFVFERSGGVWTQTETLAPEDGGVNGVLRDVALDENTIVGGVPGSLGFAGKVYIFKKHLPYSLIAGEEIKLDENIIHSGGVGVLDSDGEIEIEDNTQMTDPSTFAEADDVDIDNSSQVNKVWLYPADPIMPEFYYNNHPSDDEVEVDDGEMMYLDQAVYEDIEVDDNATIIFSGHENVYIEDFRTKNNVTILFDQCTNLMVSGKFKLGYDNEFNATNSMPVHVYAEDRITIKSGSEVWGTLYTQDDMKVNDGSPQKASKLHGVFIAAEKINLQNFVEVYCWEPSFGCENTASLSEPVVENGHVEMEKEPRAIGAIEKNDFIVYPNPVYKDADIRFETPTTGEVKVFNLQGEIVLQQQFSETRNQRLNIQSLENGIYIVTLMVTGEMPVSRKIIIQK